MRQLGKKHMVLELREPLDAIPGFLKDYQVELKADGTQLLYHYDANESHTGIANVMKTLSDHSVGFKDLSTHQSSLEDIFVDLIKDAS
jgi:ABC-2 type transport system ATP-binding protein